jgi:hypothetical protein
MAIFYHSQATYVSYGASGNNYNHNDWLRAGVQSSSGTRYETLIAFNLSSIPTYARINSAVLRLYSFNDGDVWNNTVTLLAKRNISAFAAPSVTYATKPATTSTNQASLTKGGYDTWYEWNVKDIVQLWVNGTSNYGFTIVQDGLTTQRGKVFRKSGTYAPQLVIEYSLPIIFNGNPVNMIKYSGPTATGGSVTNATVTNLVVQ